jgi:hypothetical protein
MSCQIGIREAVTKFVSNKPYLKFNGKDFIEIVTSPKGKVNENNFFAIATKIANQLNEAINTDIKLGPVFYVKKYSNGVGVLIAPTEAQLNALNAPTQDELNEALAILDKETPEVNRLDLESDTAFAVTDEGDSNQCIK